MQILPNDFNLTFHKMKTFIIISFLFFGFASVSNAEDLEQTKLLRQPSISDHHIVFEYGADLWVSDLDGKNVKRITSTPAVESDPHFSPDGNWIAFTSNRSGVDAVYLVSRDGGDATRLTWYPASSSARGWTPDGEKILYASSRESAPVGFERLWTVSPDGGPSTLFPAPRASDGFYNKTGDQIVYNPVSRWDVEWRDYRGGQNTPLIILNLVDLKEIKLPNEHTTDTHPVWLDDQIYFLSDRDFTTNIWSYNTSSGSVEQVTNLKGSDIKWLSGKGGKLVYERDGLVFIYDVQTKEAKPIPIKVISDFPWMATRWENVSDEVKAAALSPTGKRIIMEARGEIFTVPVEHGDTRDISQSSGAADRAPMWSPKGDQVAWFSDAGNKGYALYIKSQDGSGESRILSIGESKLAWEPTWSPDGKWIAYVDDDVRIKIVNVESGVIKTADVGGTNLERGSMGICWSPDSKWLAYAKSAPNNFRQIWVWSIENNSTKAITNKFADAFSPTWDRDSKHFYFLASTDVALGSGWANTSAMSAEPKYGVYVITLDKEDKSPFDPQSDEEKVSANDSTKNKGKEEEEQKSKKDKNKEEEKTEEAKQTPVKIDFENIDRRILSLPMPVSNYSYLNQGPKGSVFVSEQITGAPFAKLQKFVLEDRKAKDFVSNISFSSVSADGNKMLIKQGKSWKVIDTASPPAESAEAVKVSLQMQLDRSEEWHQIFEEVWRYERDYFYDPNMHGRDWQQVYERYAPLVPFVKHREDLNYILDQVNGELSVGHSFVGGGDFPSLDTTWVGLLGADFEIENGFWKIKRIYSFESWNPGLNAPLDRPGLKVKEGDYLLGVNGKELTANDDPYKLLDGTKDRQTVIHVNDKPDFKSARKETVTPIGNENSLRQRAWIEENRRKVDELSNGKLAYVWVPNTAGAGINSFNRYFFAQQDKAGAIIDERFNGGGLLDDYMVDLMTRKLRAAVTNEAPNGKPLQLPAGILGPKVLLINELSGSGGDFFPWVFRQQKAGPLVGTTTWGGLVASSVHYRMIDGGYVTAPSNAVFDPINKKWIAENIGVAPDIEVRLDAISNSKEIDPQLERAVTEALKLLKEQGEIEVVPPPFSTPAIPKGN